MSFQIKIQCPICKTKKNTEIPKYLFENKKTGTVKIQIHNGICCEHEFIVFVNKLKNKPPKVRGYESIDLALDLSYIKKLDESGKIYLKNMIKSYGDYAICSCIHALLLDYPIFILRTKYEKSHASEISTLLNSFIPEEYKDKMVLVSNVMKDDFKKAKISDNLVITPSGLVANSPWENIPFNFEKDCLITALDILDDKMQSIIMQQELEKIYRVAYSIYSKIREDSIFEDDLKKQIQEEFSRSISKYELKLLKQIVQHRFKGNLKKIKIRSLSKLKEGLW